MQLFKILFILAFVGHVYGTIKYAAVIYRHGDRTPVEPYPTDPWRDPTWWSVPFGELTNTGKVQHYKLGQWLRKRYSGLISNEFKPNEIYVRSTDMDRTLMSAQANLAGMYPPIGNSIWNDKINWQPVPVHTNKHTDDEILAMDKPCKNYDVLLAEYKKSPDYLKSLEKYKDLMEYMSNHTGTVIKDFNGIEYVYNTLSIEKENNKTLPKWTDSVFPDKMREPACYSFTIPTKTQDLARLKVGPLMKEIATNMIKASTSNDKLPHYNLSIYSAHDDTIGDILNALRMFDVHCPPFTATVMFELIYNEALYGSPFYEVRILYRNSTDIVEPVTLNIPYCGTKCRLSRFLEINKYLLPDNWEGECSQWHMTVSPSFIFIMIFSLFVICKYLKMKVYQNYYNKYYQDGVTISPDGKVERCLICENS